MKGLTELTKKCSKYISAFEKSPKYNFGDVLKKNWKVKPGCFEAPGVYAIYEKGKELIYIGSAGKGGHYLKYRLGDLFAYNPRSKDMKFKHTLPYKLLEKIERFNNIDKLRNHFVNKCNFKVVETRTVREARIVESILIELLNPKYNSE